jgi:hypothetical protein
MNDNAFDLRNKLNFIYELVMPSDFTDEQVRKLCDYMGVNFNQFITWTGEWE